jgi:Ca2+-binding RTX toxin-like protein
MSRVCAEAYNKKAERAAGDNFEGNSPWEATENLDVTGRGTTVGGVDMKRVRHLVFLVAIAAVGGGMQPAEAGCLLNGTAVAGDPVVIEGTKKSDLIDCRDSGIAHEIYGFGGSDEIHGSHNGDFIAGGGGPDIIYGGSGDDAIDGGASDDDIYGGPGNDVIFGGVGSSPASGVGCVLKTKGGSGDDSIFGGDGNDCIDAGSGEDVVEGGDGNDTIEGGNHADILDGGPGRDHIDGGWHSDTCIADFDDVIVNCEKSA